MVFPRMGNLKGAINLLAKHNPGQLMRKGHRRHGKPQRRFPLYFLPQSPGAADDKGQAAGAVYRGSLHILGKLGRGKLFALDAQSDDRSAARFLKKPFSLLL